MRGVRSESAFKKVIPVETGKERGVLCINTVEAAFAAL
jgi:hypothetical protein